MALDCLDDHERALALFADMQHLRDEDGRYWTGSVPPATSVFWPVEHTTYTAAAVILAVDALVAGTHRRPPGSCAATLLGALRRDRPRVRLPRRRLSRRRLRPSPERPASAPASSPSVSDRREGAARRARAGRRGTAAARRPRVGEDVVDDQHAAVLHPARPAGVVVLGVLLGVPAVDEQQRQRSAPVGARPSCDRPTTATTWSSRPGARDGAAEDRQGVHQPELGVDERWRRGAPSRPGSPPSRGGGRR